METSRHSVFLSNRAPSTATSSIGTVSVARPSLIVVAVRGVGVLAELPRRSSMKQAAAKAMTTTTRTIPRGAELFAAHAPLQRYRSGYRPRGPTGPPRVPCRSGRHGRSAFRAGSPNRR